MAGGPSEASPRSQSTSLNAPDIDRGAPLQRGRGQTFDIEDQIFGRRDLSYETSASVSGGTETTKYFLSGLVKNDEGIAINTGYKKQSLRANIDQELANWINLSVNTNVIHSRSRRGLSNNDNSGTSPYLVFPFTPNFVDLSATGDEIIDFPLNPFERSNPIQTFSFLKNEEDVWRALGAVTARMALKSTARHNVSLITIAGVDYFNQENDFVSPPQTGVRAQRRAGGDRRSRQGGQPEPQLRGQRQLHLHPRIGPVPGDDIARACSTRTATSTRPGFWRARSSPDRRIRTRRPA